MEKAERWGAVFMEVVVFISRCVITFNFDG
jgi:hypothetical protein